MTIDEYLAEIDAMKQQQQEDAFYGSLLQLGGGLLSGIGQTAALNTSIQANKDLQAQQLAQQEELLGFQRATTQNGSYFDAGIPVKAPATPRALRRPDGSLVYDQNGALIPNQSQ